MRLDLDEGADALMVKPALPYLDILAEARPQLRRAPGRVPRVRGVRDDPRRCRTRLDRWRPRAMEEALVSIKRAGADLDSHLRGQGDGGSS